MSNWAIIPSDSDIMHRSHKYIEKVRTTKGGWRYIYKRNRNMKKSNKGFGAKELKRYKETKKNYEEEQKKHQQFLENNEKNRQLREKTGNQDNPEALQRSKEAYDKSTSLLEGAKRVMQNAEAAYRNTLLGKLEYSAKAGGEIIADFLTTFPQMASMKMSFLMNGSPYSTKGAIDKVSDQILKAANDLSKLPTPKVKTDSGTFSELNRSIKDINKEINNDIDKLLKSNDKIDPLDWYKRKKRG